MRIQCFLSSLTLYFSPQSLELTAANETILMDNLPIFRQNGFECTVKEDGEYFVLYVSEFKGMGALEQLPRIQIFSLHFISKYL